MLHFSYIDRRKPALIARLGIHHERTWSERSEPRRLRAVRSDSWLLMLGIFRSPSDAIRIVTTINSSPDSPWLREKRPYSAKKSLWVMVMERRTGVFERLRASTGIQSITSIATL